MSFNDKIDKFMKDNNIKTLKQLAISSCIPYTTLRDFYDKKSADNSRLSTIRKLSNYMKCSMDYLAYDNITSPNEIDINGLDIADDSNSNLDSYQAKFLINATEKQQKNLVNFLNGIDVNYSLTKNNSHDSEYDVLFSKYKELTHEDKELIKNIIDTRKKQIDKELGED